MAPKTSYWAVSIWPVTVWTAVMNAPPSTVAKESQALCRRKCVRDWLIGGVEAAGRQKDVRGRSGGTGSGPRGTSRMASESVRRGTGDQAKSAASVPADWRRWIN